MKYPTWLANAIATGRVVIGVIYLWAGLEKVIGAGGTWTAKGFLAYATGGSLAWPFITGEPVEGTIYNPTHDLWVSLSANTTLMPIIDFLVQFGEVAIGVALILGIATRFAATAGALMMMFFFFAAWDFAFGIVNQHLTYAIVTFGLALVGAGNFNGLDARIAKQLPDWARDYVASGAPAKAGGRA